MITTFRELRLLQLSLRDIGPFRTNVTGFRFMGTLDLDMDSKPPAEAPANLYMLLARNGKGKTTILQTIYSLMDMTGEDDGFGQALSVFDDGGWAQLDLRITLTIDDTTRTMLLSIWYGSEEPLVDWSESEIDEVADASEWAKIGFVPRGGENVLSPETNHVGREIRDHIAYCTGEYPNELYGLSSSLPSVLFFPANRAVLAPVGDRAVVCPKGWGYRPAQMFNADGPDWESSVDSVLVWLEWLNDGRLEDLLTYVNENLFVDTEKAIERPRRADLATVVSTQVGNHTLGNLSHGERALLQLYVRTLCHMTENSILLIDEIESHLHTRWMNRFFLALKSLIRDVPSLTVVFTTHNRELIRVFDHKRAEEGLVKGGYLIDEGME